MLDAKDMLIISLSDNKTDRSHPSLAIRLGVSVKELTDAAERLESHGYIRDVHVINIDQMDSLSVALDSVTLTEYVDIQRALQRRALCY